MPCSIKWPCMLLNDLNCFMAILPSCLFQFVLPNQVLGLAECGVANLEADKKLPFLFGSSEELFYDHEIVMKLESRFCFGFVFFVFLF